jgi:hypothetical protein
MNQNIWGPHMWFSLHTISFNYPIKPTENDKYYYKNYFDSLQHVIPCSVCKKNYMRHLNELPIDKAIENRKSLVYWVIDLHNLVNSETGKKILTYDVVLKKYEKAYNKKIILEGEDNTSESEDNYIYSSSHISDKYDRNKIIIISFLILLFILLVINLSKKFSKGH